MARPSAPRLVRFRAPDLNAFTPRDDMVMDFARNTHDWGFGPPGPTWTLRRGTGQVLGVAGGVRSEDDLLWRLWALLGCGLTRRDWPWLIALARSAIWDLALKGPRLFEASTRVDTRGGVGVLQRLGFEFRDHFELAGARYVRMRLNLKGDI